tara:strand:+ start:43164 stop:43550 length:387 start_codon:yes stop_codon:yes gene_type:complete
MFRWFKTLKSVFVSWIRSFTYTDKPDTEEIVDNDYKLLSCNEIPHEMNSRTIYLEGNSKVFEDYWYAHFICPCGCKEKIMLNLLNDVSPSWRLILNENKTTFSFKPSVWRTENCKSHFWITDSKIVWV